MCNSIICCPSATFVPMPMPLWALSLNDQRNSSIVPRRYGSAQASLGCSAKPKTSLHGRRAFDPANFLHGELL